MRETRFRGKCNKEWCYGYYVNNHGGFLQHVILPVGVFADELKDIGRIEFDEYCIVDPDTVGQGIYIDGEWYYEGDIFWDGDNEEYCVLVWDGMGFVLEREGGIIAVDDFCWLRKVGNVWDSLELVGWYSHES